MESQRGEGAVEPEELRVLVEGMGGRIAAAYIPGTIAYLRAYEQEIWERLDALDEQDGAEAIEAYERTYLEGIERYRRYVQAALKAA